VNAKAGKSLLHGRWLIMALIALAVIVVEVLEHEPKGLYALDPDFVREIMVFGVAFPLIGGVALGALARTRLDQGHRTTILTNDLEGKKTNVQRVLIVENSRLLGVGVQSLLSGEPDLDVIRISPKDRTELIQAIERFRPEVVVVDEAMHLAGTARLLTFLEVWPELRVVVLSANSNLVRLYHKQRILVTQVSDLITVLRASQSLL
jgi:hypothetical protein